MPSTNSHAYSESGSGFCGICDAMPGEGAHALPRQEALITHHMGSGLSSPCGLEPASVYRGFQGGFTTDWSDVDCAACLAKAPAGVVPPPPMPTFYLTFGVKYRYETHPYWAGAHPDGWLEVQARDESEARIIAQRFVGNVYAFIYDEARFDRKWHPRGRLALLLQDGGTITEEGVEPPTSRFTESDPEFYGVDRTEEVAARIEGERAEHSDRDALEQLGYEVELVHKRCLNEGLSLFKHVTDVDSRVQAGELDWASPHHCEVCQESIT